MKDKPKEAQKPEEIKTLESLSTKQVFKSNARLDKKDYELLFFLYNLLQIICWHFGMTSETYTQLEEIALNTAKEQKEKFKRLLGSLWN